MDGEARLYWAVSEYPRDETNVKEFDSEYEALEYAKTQTEAALMGVWNHHYGGAELWHLVCEEGVFSYS